MSVNSNEQTLIERACRGHDILTSTVVRVYFAQSGREWQNTDLIGGLALTRDSRSFFFKLVDLNTGNVLFDQDLAKDIRYEADRPYFHTFFGDSCLTGFSFADEGEAAIFHQKYRNRDREIPTRPPPQAIPQFNTISKPTTSDRQDKDTNSKKKKSKDTSGGLFGSFGKSKTKERGKIDKSMISGPSDFQHLSHVGYNPKTGSFSAQNIPADWKAIFAKAGITEAQLQDKRTAKFIAKFMQDHGGTAPQKDAASAAQRRAPPPPPPSKGNRAPPPPPPSRRPANDDRSSTSERPVPPPPPAAPDRNVAPKAPPAPPLPSRNTVDASATPSAPPPPPPPSFGGPPAPPPPPPSVGNVPTPPRPAQVKSTLPAPADDRGDLMAAIRQFKGTSMLKSAQERTVEPAETAESGDGDDLAAALRNALASRQNALAASDSEDEDDDDDWDD